MGCWVSFFVVLWGQQHYSGMQLLFKYSNSITMILPLICLDHIMIMKWKRFRITYTGPLCRDSIGHQWFLLTMGQWWRDLIFNASLKTLLNKESEYQCFDGPWSSCYVTLTSLAKARHAKGWRGCQFVYPILTKSTAAVSHIGQYNFYDFLLQRFEGGN